MSEKPILFSGAMVKAILDGRKTQTRRAVKSFKHFVPALNCEMDCIKDRDGMPSRLDIAPDNWDCCHYGQPGHRLWVRETGWERPYRTTKMMREGADTWEPYYYDADGYDDNDGDQFKSWGFKRRPSIFMPRWASRITLEITDVRCQRLQDISYEDAVAEGFGYEEDRFEHVVNGETFEQCSRRLRWPQRSFELLWGKINAKRAPWASNPWVWAISFRRVRAAE